MAGTGVMTTAFVTASDWSRKHKVENQPGRREGVTTRRGEKQQPAINQTVKCANGRLARTKKGERTINERNRRHRDRISRPDV